MSVLNDTELFMLKWFFFFFFLIFIYLTLLGLSCGMWDLVPQTGIEPVLLALGAWSLNHWTTRKSPK